MLTVNICADHLLVASWPTFICSYNNCNFSCNSTSDLWYIDVMFPYKNIVTCELVKEVVIWTIWREKKLTNLWGGNYKSIRK
jgi:hypothetical protein